MAERAARGQPRLPAAPARRVVGRPTGRRLADHGRRARHGQRRPRGHRRDAAARRAPRACVRAQRRRAARPPRARRGERRRRALHFPSAHGARRKGCGGAPLARAHRAAERAIAGGGRGGGVCETLAGQSRDRTDARAGREAVRRVPDAVGGSALHAERQVDVVFPPRTGAAVTRRSSRPAAAAAAERDERISAGRRLDLPAGASPRSTTRLRAA